MLRSVCPSVRLSVTFFDSVPFARRRFACVAASDAFDRGQHGRLCLRPNAVSRGSLALARGTLLYCRQAVQKCPVYLTVVYQ